MIKIQLFNKKEERGKYERKKERKSVQEQEKEQKKANIKKKNLFDRENIEIKKKRKKENK